MKLSYWPQAKKITVCIIAGILLGLAAIQVGNPEIKNPPVTGKLAAPKEVTRIFERACYDCHSNETRLKWYDKVAPVSWVINQDVKEARSRFNFSEWDKLTAKEQQTILWKTVNAVIAGKMPLPGYAAVHAEAHISKTEVETLKAYVNSLHNNKPADASSAATAIRAADDELRNYRLKNAAPDTTDTTSTALNGVKYVSGYRKWKVINSTNRLE